MVNEEPLAQQLNEAKLKPPFPLLLFTPHHQQWKHLHMGSIAGVVEGATVGGGAAVKR